MSAERKGLSTDWLAAGKAPDGDALRYDVEVDLSNENTSHAQLALLTGHNKKVLEVGPATGYLTRILRQAGCAVTAVEIDPLAAAKAKAWCERMIVGDIEALDFQREFGDQRFDVAIYGDVLEHLIDPAEVLIRTASILAPEGYVAASIPNITHGSVRLALLSGSFRYTDVGLLDRTHIRFFDREGVEDLFRAVGYSIAEWRDTTSDVFDTELGLREQDFPPHLVDMVRRAPDALIYQFVIQATPQATETPLSPGGTGTHLDSALAPLWRLEEHVLNLEAHRRSLETALREKDARMAELKADTRSALAEKDSVLAEREVDIGDLKRHVNRVEETFGYRLTQKLSRWVNRVGPWGTRRRSLVLTPARLLKVAVSDGWRPFVRRLSRVWEWAPRMFERAYPRPEQLSASERYTLWLELTVLSPKQIRQARRRARRFPYRPMISIVMPVRDPDPGWLRAAFISVLGQVYENWELCVVDDASTNTFTREVLRDFERKDHRIRVLYLEQNQGIAAASNEGVSLATGEFVGFLDHDDELKKIALYEVVKLLNERPELDFIYSDEDKKGLEGFLSDPFFKPDWSPDLLMSVNYVTHFAVYRNTILKHVGGLRREFEGSQDYDLILRASEVTDRIGHIPVPIYTWRKAPESAAAQVDAKPYALRAARRALTEAIQRRGYSGRVEDGLVRGRYRVRYDIKGDPKVVIIIPTRDKVDLLRRCIHSIQQRTTYSNYEVIVVDNQSREPESLQYLRSFHGRVVHYPRLFNYARLMNFAVSEAGNPDFIIFLNNDTEVISEEWIEALLEHGQRPEVAAVGARLLYPTGSPQHEGIIIGFVGSTAGNVNFGGFDGMGETIRNCSAVTGACMLTRADVYRELGGFEERLGIAFNDVDFCLRARKKGYEIVYTPYALLYHQESATRGSLHPDEDEWFFRARWGNPGEYVDPYYSPNLNTERPFQLRWPAAIRPG